jgi:hypothetical protein
MSHLSVKKKLHTFFKPALLRSKVKYNFRVFVPEEGGEVFLRKSGSSELQGVGKSTGSLVIWCIRFRTLKSVCCLPRSF